MKKKLLILAMIAVLMMSGCTKNEKVENNLDQNLNNSQQQDVAVNNETNISLEERIHKVQDYINEFDSKYGNVDYINGERYISNAKLNKDGNNYTMTISFVSPKLFDKKEIDNAVLEAQKNGTYKFNDYTFYKDLDSFLNYYEGSTYKDIVDNFVTNELKNGSVFVTSGYSALFFKPTANNSDKYMLVYVGIPNGAVETERDETEISIQLVANDIIEMYNLDDDSSNVLYTVEEYYNKSINNERLLIGNYGGEDYYYEFKNDIIGSPDFIDDKIVIYLQGPGGGL